MLILHDDAYYESRKPQPDLGPLKNFQRFIWNPEKRSFLDRSSEDWAHVGIFYMIFFAVIFSLFTFKMWITFNYIYSMDQPYVFVPKNAETSLDGINRMSLLAQRSNGGLEIEAFLRDEFLRTDLTEEDYFGTITDGTTKLEVLLANVLAEPPFRQGQKLKILGNIQKHGSNIILQVSHIDQIESVEGPFMPLSKLLAVSENL